MLTINDVIIIIKSFFSERTQHPTSVHQNPWMQPKGRRTFDDLKEIQKKIKHRRIRKHIERFYHTSQPKTFANILYRIHKEKEELFP